MKITLTSALHVARLEKIMRDELGMSDDAIDAVRAEAERIAQVQKITVAQAILRLEREWV